MEPPDPSRGARLTAAETARGADCAFARDADRRSDADRHARQQRQRRQAQEERTVEEPVQAGNRQQSRQQPADRAADAGGGGGRARERRDEVLQEELREHLRPSRTDLHPHGELPGAVEPLDRQEDGDVQARDEEISPPAPAKPERHPAVTRTRPPGAVGGHDTAAARRRERRQRRHLRFRVAKVETVPQASDDPQPPAAVGVEKIRSREGTQLRGGHQRYPGVDRRRAAPRNPAA